MLNNTIEFIDLKKQQSLLIEPIKESINRVLEHGQYIMGPEVHELENSLSLYTGAKFIITCSSGTDALLMALLALNLKKNDVVFIPSFTFTATAEPVALLGAIPFFVDCSKQDYNLDTENLIHAIHEAKKNNLTLRGVISVDLFGLPGNHQQIKDICEANNLWHIVDGAQSFGASYENKRTGCYGDITTTSFFPAKPLGCYGDGGALFTQNEEIAQKLRSIRVHGKGTDKYDNINVGINGRLDTIQAAILLEKLKIFNNELKARNHCAELYNQQLKNHVFTPRVTNNKLSSWAQYSIRLSSSVDRDEIQRQLSKAGIPTTVYYKTAIHNQPAYKHFPITNSNLAATDKLSKTILSLPMHPYLEAKEQTYICDNLKELLHMQTYQSEIS